MTGPGGLSVHLVDGTYELFRHHFGAAAAVRKGAADTADGAAPPPSPGDQTRVAARGVVASILGMLGAGATHLGVATDHVIESFRNDMWAGYKSSAGVPPELLAQFDLVEEGLAALGVIVWPMVELEADDALASAAAVAAEDPRVARVLICTPDKDLGQAVVGERVVQLDRRADRILDEAAIRAKFGVSPSSIPDWLALVGDSADGFPGLPGWGAKTAAAVVGHYGRLEEIPDAGSDWHASVRATVRGADRLAANLSAARPAAFLFRTLATLRVERTLLGSIDELKWRGPTPAFDELCDLLGAPGLCERAKRLAEARLA